MTFRDIFKSSFLENMDSVPLLDMAIALVLSFCWDCLSSPFTSSATPG